MTLLAVIDAIQEWKQALTDSVKRQAMLDLIYEWNPFIIKALEVEHERLLEKHEIYRSSKRI